MKEGKRVKERVRRYKRRRKKGNKKSTLKKDEKGIVYWVRKNTIP